MITQVLPLTRWEWYKLRRRRMPWILLILSVLMLQTTFWVAYALFRTDGQVTFGEGGGAASVGDGFLEALAFPNSAVGGLVFSHGFVGVLIMILAASLTGTEYGWGTMRTVLTRGTGRWPFLASKLLLVALLGAAALVVGTATIALSSLAASLTLEGGSWLAASADWAEVAGTFGKTIYGLIPYVALAVFLAVLTSSSGSAIGLCLGYYFAEGILVGLLANFDWFERASGFILGPAVVGWLETPDALSFSAGAGLAGQPDALQGFLVMLGYTVILSGLAFWIVQRRDIAGAKGE